MITITAPFTDQATETITRYQLSASKDKYLKPHSCKDCGKTLIVSRYGLECVCGYNQKEIGQLILIGSP